MSSITVAPPPPGTPSGPPIQKETTVGNYFVSNYPPFSFWKTTDTPELATALDRPPAPGQPLGLYVHIPFCRKRCHFCYFRVYTDKDSQAIRNYLDAVIQELDTYVRHPLIAGRRPNFIYFGGGTPSYLSVDQLRQLTGALQERLSWEDAEEVTFEVEPGTLTEAKLQQIRAMGVTRLSLGVENFDERILEINGRAHRAREIDRAYGWARACNFPQINIDLIAGMVEETEANWQENIRKTIAMAPDSVTIYEMEIPYNTTIYQQMKAEGKLVAPVADWETKRRWVNEAFSALEAAGYTVATAYTAIRGRQNFVYRDQLWAGADLLGLGVASFGHLGGVHYQNLHDFDPYVAAVREGRSPVYRALTPTPAQRYIREFILQLKRGHVSRSYFANKFGTDPVVEFAAPLQRLKDWGFVSQQGDELLLNRDGLLQVDRLLHEFFQPEHRNARYA